MLVLYNVYILRYCQSCCISSIMPIWMILIRRPYQISKLGRIHILWISHQREVVKRSAIMNLNGEKSGFTSYVDLNSTDYPGDLELEIKPRLLEGEIMIAQADKVCLYSSKFGRWVICLIFQGILGLNSSWTYFEEINLNDWQNQVSIYTVFIFVLFIIRLFSISTIYPTAFRNTSGQTGALFVTTLKLSFKNYLTSEESDSQENKLLSNTDISLSRSR